MLSLTPCLAGVYFSLQHMVNGRHSYDHLAYLKDSHELDLLGEDRPVDLELLDPKKTSQSIRLNGVHFAAFYHVLSVSPRPPTFSWAIMPLRLHDDLGVLSAGQASSRVRI